MSWCRILGSSGDIQARISAVPSLLLKFRLHKLLVLLKEFVLLNEFKLVLLLKELLLKELLFPPRRDSDISVLLVFGSLRIRCRGLK